jgi:hypothetical protein
VCLNRKFRVESVQEESVQEVSVQEVSTMHVANKAHMGIFIGFFPRRWDVCLVGVVGRALLLKSKRTWLHCCFSSILIMCLCMTTDARETDVTDVCVSPWNVKTVNK